MIGNNIPIAQCGDNDVTIAGTTNGAEANGATPSQAVFTVTQARISTEPTTVSYGVSGTATIGIRFHRAVRQRDNPGGRYLCHGDSIDPRRLADRGGRDARSNPNRASLSGDLTTQLSTSPSLVTATLDIVDDDFADYCRE